MNPQNDLDLLRQLRQLPREREPAHELWSGIAARLDPHAARTGGGNLRERRRTPRWLLPALALAASVALVAVFVTRPAPQAALPVAVQPVPVPAPAATSSAPAGNELVRRQAEAMTLEYRLAIQSFAGDRLPPELESAAVELDDSAQRIRLALREKPDAVYLLDRLRRTYDQRLKLSQRALLG